MQHSFIDKDILLYQAERDVLYFIRFAVHLNQALVYFFPNHVDFYWFTIGM